MTHYTCTDLGVGLLHLDHLTHKAACPSTSRTPGVITAVFHTASSNRGFQGIHTVCIQCICTQTASSVYAELASGDIAVQLLGQE